MVATAPTGALAEPRRSLLAGAMIGVGIMAGVDEIIFHQVLAWHHFFDRSTPAIGLLSDGLLHAAELIVIVAGFFMFWGLVSRRTLEKRSALAGFFVGAGGFQILDGIVDHKVLRLHQVRYVENLWPYDVAWIVSGFLLLLIGIVLAGRSRRSEYSHRAGRGVDA